MSDKPAERLYHLLPAVYRQRDFHEGEPLRALLGVMEAELETIEDDVEGLYENWFVETCEDWVVPYLADLSGIRGLEDEQSTVVSQRARVANTLGYRRRKGTPAALEGLVRDVTGWAARAVETFDLLATTQHLEHPRPGKGGLFDLRAVRDPQPLGGPFETAPHNADLRSIADGEGRYNLYNLGLFVWRLRSFGLLGGHAPKEKDGYFRFHPLGFDVPLFTRSRSEDEIARAAEADLPGPIRPSAFARDLELYRELYEETPDEHRPAASAFYGPGRSLRIFKDGNPVPPYAVIGRDLAGDLNAMKRPPAGSVAVDVVRGRIAFAEGQEPQRATVDYCYGFSAELGGGPYDRRDSLSDPRQADWRVRVSKEGDVPSLQGALKAWREAGRPRGLIRIADSETYGGSLRVDFLAPGGELTLEAEDGVRPCLRLLGRLVVDAPSGARLTLNGLWIEGGLELTGDVGLRIRHCTILQTVAGGAPGLELSLDHSITDALSLPAEARLSVRDSIVGDGSAAITGSTASLERSTVFGAVEVRELTLASEVLFTGTVTAEHRQTGCVRFSYFPEGSKTPRRFRCPEAGLKPRFTSTSYAHPAFAQLAHNGPAEIRTGAEDGSEIGAFHDLRQTQRETNLRGVLEEYLPLGLEAGVFYVT